MANFYSSHQETLALLKEQSIALENNLATQNFEKVKISTRFGMVDMPRESLSKKTLNNVNIKV